LVQPGRNRFPPHTPFEVVLRMSSWLVDYPFADRLYPGALDAVKHVQQWGRVVILSDDENDGC
jgi:hypothetical protein